jgi:hypothetical protein
MAPVPQGPHSIGKAQLDLDERGFLAAEAENERTAPPIRIMAANSSILSPENSGHPRASGNPGAVHLTVTPQC